MSKLDAQRAMREANYERQRAAAPPRPAKAAAPVAPPTRSSAAKAASPGAATTRTAAPSSATGTCGHKSMNGRACTREAGHSEKSHRYS
jgi:hypothetical protein